MNEIQIKICLICKETKTFGDFYILKSTGKPKGPCKACQLNQKATHYAKNKESKKAKSRAYYAANTEQCLLTAATYRDKHRAEINEKARIRWNLNAIEINAHRRESYAKLTEAERQTRSQASYVAYKRRMDTDPHYRQKELERKRPLSRLYFAENKESLLTKARDTYHANPGESRERVRLSLAKRRTEKPEEVKEAARIWRKNNPEKVSAFNAQRSAVRRSGRAQGFVEVEHFQRMAEWQMNRCYHCNAEIFHYSEKEHLVPVTRKGSHTAKNLALACKTCNQNKKGHKGDRFLHIEWVPPIEEIHDLEVYQEGILAEFGFPAFRVISSFLASSRNLVDPKNWMKHVGQEIPIFYDFEWKNHQQAIRNLIWNRLRKPLKRTFARKCSVGEICQEEAGWFLDQWHIQGYRDATIHLGLRDSAGALVGVASWTIGARSAELIRLAFHGAVPGGFSKLLSAFKKGYRPENMPIVSFCDPRYSGNGGESYLKVGFEDAGLTENPSYYYVGPAGIVPRQSMQKSKMAKILDYFNPDLSEELNAKVNGLYRLYGHKQRRFLIL